MTLCREASIVNPGPAYRRAVTLKCRAWTCEHCHDMRVRQLVREIIDGHPERLLTLTMAPNTSSTPERQAQALAANFRRLIRLIRKNWPVTKHEYFAVFEAHKSGWPHLHIAMRGTFLPWAWLKEKWTEISGSGGVDIRFIHNPHDCAAYVAKYMGKDSHRFGSSKRYWHTKAWRLEPDRKPPRDLRFGSRYLTVPMPLCDLAAEWIRSARHVWMEGTTLISGPEPPQGVRAMRGWIDANGW